jgi:hypothetical protein
VRGWHGIRFLPYELGVRPKFRRRYDVEIRYASGSENLSL